MSPPTEQLIRDYLNRLSVAARGRLNSDDRRALVTRTHDFIERNASRSGPATAMQVAALLSRLGDPGALVDQEVARLAAARGVAPVAPDDEPGGLAGRLRRRTASASWRWPAAAGNRDLQSELLNGSPGNGAEPPAQPSSPATLVPRQPGPADRDAVDSGSAAPPGGAAETAPPGGAAETAPSRPVWPVAAPDLGARGGAEMAGPDRPGAAHAHAAPSGTGDEPGTGDEYGAGEPGAGEQGAGEAGRTGSVGEPAVPEPDEAAAGAVAGGPAKSPGTPLAESVTHHRAGTGEGPAGAARPSATGPGEPSEARRAHPSATRQTRPSAGRPARDGPSRGAPARAWIKSLPSRGLALSRRHPLEATAIVLLGLGGVIFPPVWLLGAGVAVLSREWDYRDKWAGLAGPVVLLVLGTTVGLAVGHSHHQLGAYLHEAWVYLNILSRLCAVAGTWYLCWRLTHVRKVPDGPPWNRPRRVD